jgi:hypothetical protein
MSGEFVPWVEPIASRLAESRLEIEKTARGVPVEAWDKASSYPGWSYKDHLSHLPHAHEGLHGVLRAVLEGRQPDFTRFVNIDALNEENRQQQADTSIDDLIAAFVSESQGTQRLLSDLTAEHGDVSFGPMTLGQALNGFAMHDAEHGSQITKALGA